MKKLTNSELIEQFKKVHGDIYIYDDLQYVNKMTKVKIYCKKHGYFEQLPSNHLKGNGCPQCAREKKFSNYTDIKKQMQKIHNYKYEYDDSTYKGTHTKMKMICPIHGEFLKKPNSVLTEKRGCPKCNGGVALTTEEFIEKAKLIHSDKYDYSNVEYKNVSTPVEIICKKHGSFLQKPVCHLNGHGCQLCGGSLPLNTEEFIKRSIEVHGNKYDYSKTEYVNNQTKVCIICPEHGEFWQCAGHHLNGIGCPSCNESHLERDTHLLLEKYGIKHKRGKHFKWLGKQHLDFYLPEYNIAIECQGGQHYKPCTFGGISKEEAEERLKYRIELDKRKALLCKENDLPLEYIDYNENVEQRINEIIEKYKIS